jgi:hypothetical protein
MEAERWGKEQLAEVEAYSSSPKFQEERREEVKRGAQIELEKAKNNWSVAMTLVEVEMSLTHKGPPEQIINEIDAPFVDRLTLAAPHEWISFGHAEVRLSRTAGCKIEINGTDPTWVRTARDVLSAEVIRGVPWWAPLRMLPAAIAASLVIYAAVVIAVWGLIDLPTASKLGVVAVPIPAVAIPGVLGMNVLLRRVLKGLEIVAPGEVPGSRKALGVMGTIATSFILGVIVNLITK